MSAILCLVAFLFVVDAQIARYIGCFRDSCGRDLGHWAGNLNPNGGSQCGARCRGSGFIYAGTQYYSECFCANSYGRYGAGTCNTPCTNNNGERCGDAWHNSVWYAGVQCGDRFVASVHGYETCDDGNTAAGDGCNSVCQREAGWNCPTAGIPCTSICSDRIVVRGETCDDGNTAAGDGCTGTCQLEAGFTCPPTGGACSDLNECTAAGLGCRDAKNFPTECTDSTTDRSIPRNVRRCRCGPGYEISSGTAAIDLSGSTPFAGCVDINECVRVANACIDGVSAQSVTCKDSTTDSSVPANNRKCSCPRGFYARQKSSPNNEVTLVSTSAFDGCLPICGDGLFKAHGEACDDGNTLGGDGCSHLCARETGWSCTTVPDARSVCTPVCGDGRVVGAEVCDDGNTRSGDGCSSDCRVQEPRFLCKVPGSPCENAPVVCGDKLIEKGENCDDGNNVPRDGCSGSCQREPGWSCPAPAVPCTSNCGDGLVVGKETCDESTSGGCKNCQIVTGWFCPNNGTTCYPIIGDKIIVGSEKCDDGNANSGDGCSSQGQPEAGWNCAVVGVRCLDINECDTIGCRAASAATTAALCDDSLNTTSIPQNQRKCTCKTGQMIAGRTASDSSVTLIGNAAFPGCADIDECSLYKCTDTNTKFTVKTSCTESGSTVAQLNGLSAVSLANRRCQCDLGWYPSDGKSALLVPTITIAGNAPFLGCLTRCGDKLTRGAEACDDGNTKSGDGCAANCGKVEKGWTFNATTGVASPICGDGLKLGNEGCDDNNTRSGDGCNSTCGEEEGWTCSTQATTATTLNHNVGNLCCPLIANKEFEKHHLAEELLCFDGYWTSNNSHTNPNVQIDITEALRLSENTRFCGSFKLNHDLIIADNATVVVAGDFELGPKASLTFEGLSGRLVVAPICADFHSVNNPNGTVISWSGNPGEFRMDPAAIIQVINMEWTADGTHPTTNPDGTSNAFVRAQGCATVQGAFYLHANTIPSGSNSFELIESTKKCLKTVSTEDEFLTLAHTIPGSCSNLEISKVNDGVASVTVNKKDLCSGDIAGIVIGCFFGVLLIGAILFFLLSKSGGENDYQSL